MKKCTKMVGVGFGEAFEGGHLDGTGLEGGVRGGVFATSDNRYYVYFTVCRRAHTPTGPSNAGKKVARPRESAGGP
jgi:hypothetical protein